MGPKSSSSALIFLFLAIAFGGVLVSGIFNVQKKVTGATSLPPVTGNSTQVLVTVPVANNHSPGELQLNTFQVINVTNTPVPTAPASPTIVPSQPTATPTSPPSNSCVGDAPRTAGCVCKKNSPADESHACPVPSNGTCLDYQSPVAYPPGSATRYCLYSDNEFSGWASPPTGCIAWCNAKPVIYLYPEKITTLNVRLTIPGYVYKSDPLYPEQTGWQNVTAYPGGKLIYQGKEYHELYYESAVYKHVVPQTGVIIPSFELKDRLLLYTHQLGLLPNEQQEFLDYWLPKLASLRANYILFSVMTPAEKDITDHVDLSVTPDTRIEILAYFKKVDVPYEVKPLELPLTPPKRVGFTEVEWGGTIDN